MKQQNDQDIDRLIMSYLNGTLDESAKSFLLEWIDTDRENLRYFSEIKAVHNHIDMRKSLTRKHFRAELKRLNATIDSGRILFTRHRVFRRISVAAACIAAVTTIFFTCYRKTGTVTYTTMDGNPMELTLDDGTRVWLSPHSELSLNSRRFFSDRKVSFDGEAVFDVVSNPASPFVVSTPNVKIKVLGTVFKVQDFAFGGVAKTTLAEGSVELQNAKGDYLLTLRPGQKATYGEDILQVEEVDTQDIVMMRYGITTLQNASLAEIVRRLETDFDTRLKAVSYTPNDTLFTISWFRDSQIEDVLELLETISGSKFIINE